MRLELKDIAAALDLPAPPNGVTIDNIVTDSRQVEHGSLFAALPGNNFDGHDFAESAARLGASALLVNRRLSLDLPQFVVDDVLLALGRIAALLRQRIDPLVIGITGSNGKTTVKEMLASILGLRDEVLATQGNYNNELGLPLTLFRLEDRHRYAVLEMGANKAGDIAYLAGIARPQIGMITNIGPAHLGGFGSEEGVARAKGEMYAGMDESGCAVINADEPWCDLWGQMNRAGRTISFGCDAGSDVRLVDNGGPAVIRTAEGEFPVELALPGRHNCINAAAATAAALAAGIGLDQIRQGLKAVQPVPGRLNLLKTEAGWTVIDDTYNANPASLYSALQVLSGLQGKPWLALGDMKELGPESRKLHREVGEAARAMGVRRLFTTGELSVHTADAFGEGAEHFESREALAEALLSSLRPDVICLVKGSRSMGMEKVVEAITGSNGLREAS